MEMRRSLMYRHSFALLQKKFFKDMFDKSQAETTSNLNDTTRISSLTYEAEPSTPEVPKQ